jgi:hypothetical protein
MISAMLVLAAVYMIAGKQIADRLRSLFAKMEMPALDAKSLAAVALLVAAAAMYMPHMDATPSPAPAPEPPNGFSLKGKFIGPTASQDAATFGALCDELANVLDYDWAQAEPRIKTGAAIEDLRLAAREARLRGVSLGARQPYARDAVKAYLDQVAGTSGGPLTPEQQSAWVSAFRAVGRAANDAAR